MPVRVLIAEDTEHLRDMLFEMLSLYGFDVVAQAQSAQEAVRRVYESDPEVVVMGHAPRGMDALEAARRIRGDGVGPQVVIFSAYLDGHIERRAKEAGVAACIPRQSGVEALTREITAVALAR
jgi:DNA-binding NarL/FixJ family response regulator